MKALVYRRFGTADVLEWVDDWPYPQLSAGSVLVRTVAGSVNPKDVLVRKGKFRHSFARDPLPRASGLDVAGRVVAVGDNVTEFSVGDAVFGMTNHFSGGVHVEVACFDRGEVQHAPANLSLEMAAAVPLAAQTAFQAIRDCCAPSEGQRILINGASGGVGHYAVQIAKAMGLEVHGVCGPRNIDFVKSLGADVVHDYSRQPAVKIGSQFDAVFDVFGKFTRSMFSGQLTPRGVYVSTVPKPQTLAGELVARLGLNKTSRLVQVRSDARDLLQLKQWIEQGLLRPHVQKTYPVTEAADAHRQIESRHTVGKVCLTFGAG